MQPLEIAESVAARTDVTYCSRCGAQLAEGASFCHNCGTPIRAQIQKPSPGSHYGPTYAITVAAVVLCGVIVVGVLVAVGLPSILGGIAGSGHLVTTQENFTGFTAVSISSGFKFTIVQSPTYSVNVTIDDNLVDYVKVSQIGNALSVGFAPGRILLVSPEVTISMPDLTRLDISGGTTGSTVGFHSSHPFAVSASGGSIATSSGTATDLTANGSGGSQLDFSNLHVTNAHVDLSGGSRTTVNLDGRLDAALSGGSQLFYIGNPTMGSISTSGGSTVSKE